MPIKGILGGNGVKPLGYGLGAGGAVVETDPEFNQTVLLLHGDGSEGAGDTPNLGDPNYKAFRDNSTSAHAITVEGDAYGNDFSPYYYADGYWSVAFDGNDLMKEIGTNDADLKFGTSDFTIEFFIFKTKNPTSTAPIIDMRDSTATGSQNTMVINLNTSGQLLVYVANSERISPSSSTALADGWNHVAYARDYSTPLATLYLNGTSVGTWADNINYNETNTEVNIGGATLPGLGKIFGYISNVRICKSLVYSSGFTPTTVPLTTTSQSASNCVFLGCQSNRFVDNSTNNFSISFTDDPKISTNTPFTITKTANVGSGFFDGSGDKIQNNDNILDLDTVSWTVEAWFYQVGNGENGDATGNTIIIIGDSSSNNSVWLTSTNAGAIAGRVRWNNTSWETTLSGGTVKINQWTHVAIVKDSSNSDRVDLYVNGVSQANSTNSTDLTTYGREFAIGGQVGANRNLNGYIADARVVIGSAVYTSTFTPPTSSLTAVTNTNLLTCQYSGAVRNVGFVDDSKYNHRVTRTGDSHMGTFSPFSLEDGYWSNFFDGADDYYSVPNSTDTKIGAFTEDYTLECWFQLTASGAAEVLFGQSDGSGPTPKWIIGINQNSLAAYSANKVGVASFNGGTAGDGTYSPGFDVGTWYHFRLVYTHSGTTLKVYINGTEVVSNAGNVVSSTGAFTMGADGEGNGDFNGYISNIRLIKGTALDSTVPTEPLTAVANTKLLTAQSNRFVDNSSSPLTITITGTPKVLPFSPLAPSRSYTKDAVGGSLLVNPTSADSGDYLTIDDDGSFNPEDGDFSIECWVYPTSFQATNGNNYFSRGQPLDAGFLNFISIQANNSTGATAQVRFFIGSGGTYLQSDETLKLNSWNFILAKRVGTTQTLEINGVSKTAVNSNNVTEGTNSIVSIGSQTYSQSATDRQGHGFIANTRYMVGSASSQSGVPTSPLTESTDTVLLLNYANAGIIDHTMRNNLETKGNTRISTIQKKFGTGSIYFDGDGDYLTGINQTYLTIGTGSYTFECWVYITTGVQQYHGLLSIVGGIQFQLSDERMRLSTTTAQILIADVADAISLNTWTHLAFVRDASASNALKFFKDGTLIKSGTDSTNWNHTGALQVGRIFNSSVYDIEGYLDDVRLTLEPRYSSDFTPPTKAFPDK